MSDLILHHYWPSPFAHKIRLALGLINVDWRSVEIPRIPPKPLLMPLTAGYRRTPVLQIGADIYCDTQNIVRVLAEYDVSDQLLPESGRGQILSFTDWIDTCVIDLAVRVVLTSVLDTAPPEFIEDRGGLYFGPSWTPRQLKKQFSGIVLQLAAHFDSIEKGLASSGSMFNSHLSYADVSIAFLAWFIRGRWEQGSGFLAQFPNIERIEKDVHASVSERHEDFNPGDALEVAKKSVSAAPRGVKEQVGLQLSEGQHVSIKPQSETSAPPVIGRLRHLDRVRVSIDHSDESVGDVVVHLPIAGYQIQLSD